MELYRILIVCFVIFYKTHAFPNSIQTENSNEIYKVAEQKDEEEGDQKSTKLREHFIEVQSLDDSPYKCNPPVAPPLPPENGYVIGQNFELGSTIEVRCNNGYVINGPSIVHCIAVPNPWKHQVIWDSLIGPLPTCIEQSQKSENVQKENVTTNTLQPPPPPPFKSQGKPIDDKPVKVKKEKNGGCYKILDSGDCIDYKLIFYFDQNDGECKPANVCASNVSDYFISADICQLYCLDIL